MRCFFGVLGAVALVLAGCGGAPSAPLRSSPKDAGSQAPNERPVAGFSVIGGPADPDAPPSGVLLAGDALSAPASASPQVAEAPKESPIPLSKSWTLTRLLDVPVSFFVTGEGGRLAAIREKDGVPMVFESGRWSEHPLPTGPGTPHFEVFFGRDNRLRAMGTTTDKDRSSPLYLRLRDERWRPEPKELGAFGKAPGGLYGVLGEADPEIVCRPREGCLLKSRKGWTEVREAPAEGSLFRAFEGRGYALTQAGLLVAEGKAFVPVGPTKPMYSGHGFWVDEKTTLVTTPIGLLSLEEGTWRPVATPRFDPKDVAELGDDRAIVGAFGLLIWNKKDSAWTRVGDGGPLSRVIARSPSTFAVAGPSGVYLATAPSKEALKSK